MALIVCADLTQCCRFSGSNFFPVIKYFPAAFAPFFAVHQANSPHDTLETT